MNNILTEICEYKKKEIEIAKKNVHFLHLKKYLMTKLIEILKNY